MKYTPFKLRIAMLLLIFLASFAGLALSETDAATIRELNAMNKNFLIEQRKRVERLTRRNIGEPVRNNRQDILTLQRILDKQILKPSQTLNLQALGVVLGDILIQHNKRLHWAVYVDTDKAKNKRQSHAVCLKRSDFCLFPITMISRRVEAGIVPNVDKIYAAAIAEINAQLQAENDRTYPKPEYLP